LTRVVAHLLQRNGWSATEAADLARLMELCAGLPPPADPFGLYPRAAELQARLREFLGRARPGSCGATDAAGDSDAEERFAERFAERLEEAFLELYAHLHGYEAPYTAGERRRMDRSGGYWCHAGGVSPILRARPWVGSETRLVDFGAGNGLQGLLLQTLFPHRLTVQIEISSRMIEAGMGLQEWLGVASERVRWLAADLGELPAAELRDLDFVYLYRPLRPEGALGRRFYERLAAALAAAGRRRRVVVFSIADPLEPFLQGPSRVLYGDGHLTCYEVGGAAPVSSRKSGSSPGAR
jgi:hypothetical protein